jgi:hypothetical protein
VICIKPGLIEVWSRVSTRFHQSQVLCGCTVQPASAAHPTGAELHERQSAKFGELRTMSHFAVNMLLGKAKQCYSRHPDLFCRQRSTNRHIQHLTRVVCQLQGGCC